MFTEKQQESYGLKFTEKEQYVAMFTELLL